MFTPTSLGAGAEYANKSLMGIWPDSVWESDLRKFCHLFMNAGLPNEQGIGVTVGMDIFAAFSKTDWLIEAIALLIQPPSPAGWQGLIGVAL